MRGVFDKGPLGDLAEDILKDYTLEEILEFHDMTPQDVIEFLLYHGQIGIPEHLRGKYVC